MRLGCVLALIVRCGGEAPRIWFHEAQVIEPICEARNCMPDPAISAYHKHWETRAGAALLQRGAHADIAKERKLREDETRRLRGARYYTRPVAGTVATLRDASLALRGGGFSIDVFAEAPPTPEQRHILAAAEQKLRTYQTAVGCRPEPPPPCRSPKKRPQLSMVAAAGSPRNAHVFVLPPPRTKNLYHFICDSILPITWAMAHAPGCDNRTLVCDPPAELVVLLPQRLKLKGTVAWLDLLQILFEGRVSGLESTGRVERVTWGVGESIVYGDYGERAVGLTMHYATGPAAPRAAKRDPVVVYISRGRHNDGRFLADDKQELLLGAFRRQGAQEAILCCDWSKTDAQATWDMFRQADIVVGLHGAGCSNALFAAEGVVMVELHAAKGASTLTFRRIAAARRGGFVRAVVVGKGRELGHDFVSATQPDAIARCAVTTWRGDVSREALDDICFGAAREYIEEAWTAADSVLREPPPQTYVPGEVVTLSSL